MDGQAQTFAEAIANRLNDKADPKVRRWWETYMKGALPFRGVPMAGIREVTHLVCNEFAVEEMETSIALDVALGQLAQPTSEDKIAGVLILSERLLPRLSTDHVTRLAEPFQKGHIEDWSTCDWYCVKALGRFVQSDDRKERSRRIAAWTDASTLWQRRAAAVAFVNLAPTGDAFFRGFSTLLLNVCEQNVRDTARFSQTSVGWLLRELSKAEPGRVRAFVDKHGEMMSTEARKAATAKLEHFG